MQSIIDKGNIHVKLNQNFLSKKDADALFNAIKEKVIFQEEKGLYGIKPKRTSCAFGDKGLKYRYAQTTRIANDWFDELLTLKTQIEKVVGHTYNFALINFYPDGQAQIPWHSDSEKDLNPDSSIASISVGAVRKFKMKENTTGLTTDVFLQHGSLLIMGPGVQKRYKHALLKTTIEYSPRYNITFRRINT